MLVAAELVHPGDVGQVRLAGHPRRQHQLLGPEHEGWPSRSTSTCHSWVASSKRARLASVPVQESSSMTLVYDSSQSAILSFGANTGQFSGNGM